VNADGTWKWIGRYEHYAIFDARKLEYLDTWKTCVFAQTDAYSASDVAVFSGFSNRIASGANSVSIRFLTYEDGTFIQRGNWLYFLVEGTGTTISDLYTQIVRINFNSGEVQMIGAIFRCGLTEPMRMSCWVMTVSRRCMTGTVRAGRASLAVWTIRERAGR
jgi:hypothetical protein